jgi:Putative binding domain, N-terminal
MQVRIPYLILLCGFFVLMTPAVMPAQVLNMSHDLVSLGIAGQNLTPNNPALDARPLFQAAVQYAQNHPIQIQTLTLDTGAYYMLTVQQSNAVLVFGGISNLVVDLAGSTFYFNQTLLSTGFYIYYCSNITFKNLQTDYINPPYTHVQLTSVDTTNRLLHYQTLPNWPDPSTFSSLVDPYGGVVQIYAALFRGGQIVPGTTRTAVNLPISNSTLTLTQDGTPWTQAATLSTLQPGDTIAVTFRAGGPVIGIDHSDTITLSNVKIYGSNGFAVNFYETTNSLADHVSVMPRPGTGLVGSNADGIHFSSVYQNNHIRNCYVTRTLDDALIMDNQFHATVVSVSGTRQLTVTRRAFDRFSDGTAVNFVDPLTTAEFTGATITSQNPPDSQFPGFGGQIVLTFDADLPPITAGDGMVFAAPAMRGQDSTVEDNLVEDIISGRGVWIDGTIGVTVQRNVIRRTSQAGIVVSQDTEAFPAPPAHNITITDNALENDLWPAANGTGAQNSVAAIQVVSTNNQTFAFSSTASNSNISIVNNYIADAGRSGIWIGELNGGTLQNNLIIRWDQHPELPVYGVSFQTKTQLLQDFQLPVAIRYNSTVTESGDTTSAMSTIMAPVTMTPPSLTALGAGSNGSFTLQTPVNGFAWNATSDSSWLTITSPALSAGAGQVQYSMLANSTGQPRTGKITIAGEVFTVTQNALKKVAPQITSQ